MGKIASNELRDMRITVMATPSPLTTTITATFLTNNSTFRVMMLYITQTYVGGQLNLCNSLLVS